MADMGKAGHLHGFFINWRCDDCIQFTFFRSRTAAASASAAHLPPVSFGFPSVIFTLSPQQLTMFDAPGLCFRRTVYNIKLDVFFRDDVFVVRYHLGTTVNDSFEIWSCLFDSQRFQNDLKADTIDVATGYADSDVTHVQNFSENYISDERRRRFLPLCGIRLRCEE
jgi:hypothetical protein